MRMRSVESCAYIRPNSQPVTNTTIMVAHLVHHAVRRGVEHVHQHLTKEQFISKLEQDAQAYENAGPRMEVNPRELLPVAITGLIAFFIVWSISYTIGEVAVSLASIESTSRTTVVESKPPAYTEEPLEKEPLMAAEPDAETDVEITVIEHKPITSKIRTTIARLHEVGGFRARWRGVGLSMLYHFLHAMVANFLAAFFGVGLFGESLIYIFVSVGLARLHMAWTHKMIAHPSSKPWFRSVPARKDCKAILLPAFVYAAAQQATIILPVGVAFALGLMQPPAGHSNGEMSHHDCRKMALFGLRFLAVPITYIMVGLAILLPASVTLTRIEASLLPEDQETIVPFDKAAMVGDIDVSARGGCRALFVQAWRSFDRSARLRLIKLYAKMIMAQVAVLFVAAHLMVAELYLIGGERIGVFMKSAAAQMKLTAIEAHEAHAKGN
ncbi:uncharacterized protein LTR77_000876 [Saxophila tyrrhenica]|uniref:Uncharacterized protein n=1 Tax=Saxophila tyrrhenica TaxID=1690608 RepID=A0AAV9PSD9_9PEZI|nr:hypothetical protein LTR77_000876 [Saxophila tyrrhenica]